MKNVAAGMLEVATDIMLKDCIKEIVAGRASDEQGGAELGARGRPREPLQMDTTNIGATPPPPTPKESTSIMSPPMEDVINANFPPLPFKGNMGSPGLGLIKVARTGEKTKPEVMHHQTILSASTEEEMDGVEMEMAKQTDKDNVLQLVKDGNKRGAEALDKSVDRGEIAGAKGRKLSTAKKSTAKMLLSKL